MKSVAFHTLGCKVNQYETEALKEIFIEEGYRIKEFNEKASVYVINTCTVTNVAAKKSRQIISRAKKNNVDALVIVVGCYVQNEPEQVAKLKGVDMIIGTDDRKNIIKMINSYEKSKGILKNVKNIKEVKNYEELKVHHNYGKTRSYIKIQDGCNRFCSYCIIPYTRGPIRSRQPEAVIDEIKHLVNNGYKEVVLTGIHLSSYGKDLKNTNLFDIIKLVNKINGLERIRLGSLEPTMITEEFVIGLKDIDKLCPHFHLSLQSGCDKTLKEMNRRYTTKEFYESVQYLRNHLGNIALTTDIIVGFPGESEKDYQESYEFVKKVGFAEIHVFKYSPREGTVAAARKDQINGNIKEERSTKMISLGKNMTNDYLKSFINQTNKAVLVESIDHEGGHYTGYTDNYIRVKFESHEDIRNTIINIKLKSIKEDAIGCYIMGELE